MSGKPHVLIVAGSDSSGGAGIARDIETIAAYGLRSCTAITAVTVQTHEKAGEIVCIDPSHIGAQIRAARRANHITAIKIGMLGTSGAVRAVSEVLAEFGEIPVVLDPVLTSSSGKPLLENGAIELLNNSLVPLCTLLTPNLEELAILSGLERADCAETASQQAGMLLQSGCRAVLAKGGHAKGSNAIDILYRRGETPVRFETPRIPGTLRGTGCMLSSAIAAGLASEKTLETSIGTAKTYLQNAFSLAT